MLICKYLAVELYILGNAYFFLESPRVQSKVGISWLNKKKNPDPLIIVIISILLISYVYVCLLVSSPSRVDYHYILCRHSWPPEKEASWRWWSLDFSTCKPKFSLILWNISTYTGGWAQNFQQTLIVPRWWITVILVILWHFLYCHLEKIPPADELTWIFFYFLVIPLSFHIAL